MIRLFTQEKDWIFDAFAGHNSRMEIAFANHRHYRGNDLSAEFMDFNRQIRDELTSQVLLFDEHPIIELTEGDSTQIELRPDEIGKYQLSLTSPPYWDLEFYGDEEEQLYFCKTYEDFMAQMKKVVEITFEALESGGIAAWFINDFRRKKVFYSYHSDLKDVFLEVGFVQWDIVVVDLGNSVRGAFPNQFEQYKLFPKRHEYGIIMIKPYLCSNCGMKFMNEKERNEHQEKNKCRRKP